jgi:hypothetical protein
MVLVGKTALRLASAAILELAELPLEIDEMLCDAVLRI